MLARPRLYWTVRAYLTELFTNRELTADALLASACLPTLHRPIEIDGEAYWDGGLAANPPLLPLVHHCPRATS